ncbi:MAG: DNA mismatch repair endonuclease MutL [Dehalococcoidia bacterium]|jgi:DNA mismatch repair protein MutL|nr:DNA mismatch repair endonuclease MutL [Dehalococcoidia bacterium]MDP6228329.1 DNA mismatch repair endonuclease MutL [Dehalococcoidia bacterium]MDP7085087.1 DNA mismatch repair endonuclease MutL [Dehalococcoidia bacterium]MDP7199974.1 DNA mismatch repair endonuclease MutL [Dehalococcoidia bacterium]MDP7509971.1 DNA mismatch repair endonuclease MutL [Dehalococcoidia bacterium]
MPIKVLPPELAIKIAAGEVVERPASVVKELLENSIDAGASQIIVEIKSGGVELVRVTDDGNGIDASEVELAFERHATSKLDTVEQLEAVATLGFRGEALPSIAAVSRLTMTTRPQQAQAGRHVELRWGREVRSGTQGCPPGTSVEVSDLFGNMPARRKFLKTNSTETSRVQELVARYALAFPTIRFQLIVDGRSTLATPGNGRPRETLLALYGAEVAEAMLEVSGEDPETGYRVEGFASPPSLHRANRTYMTLFVNRRWINSRMLSYAIEEAYHGLLPDRRYPLAALNLDIPYAEVDVNSHPSKREVRFHREGKVFSTLQRAVRAALVADSPVPQIFPPTGRPPGLAPPWPASPGSTERMGSFYPRGAFTGQQQDYPAPPGAAVPRQDLPALKVVGQVKLTYIVAEGPEGMFLVDQHAAHERVLFDQIRRRASERTAQSQPLLEPVTVELTAGQAGVFKSNAEFLASYGFDVESFGENAYLLRSVPSVLTGQDPAQSLVNVLDMVAFEGLLRQQEDVLAASIACHSAIRAGKSLTEAEMGALLEQLEASDNPHTCPHGRPTMLHFSSYQMDREFGRR